MSKVILFLDGQYHAATPARESHAVVKFLSLTGLANPSIVEIYIDKYREDLRKTILKELKDANAVAYIVNHKLPHESVMSYVAATSEALEVSFTIVPLTDEASGVVPANLAHLVIDEAKQTRLISREIIEIAIIENNRRSKYTEEMTEAAINAVHSAAHICKRLQRLPAVRNVLPEEDFRRVLDLLAEIINSSQKMDLICQLDQSIETRLKQVQDLLSMDNGENKAADSGMQISHSERDERSPEKESGLFSDKFFTSYR